MAGLHLVIAPNEVLLQRAAEVTEFDESLVDLSKQMIAICEEHEGIGLAANQVGVLQRVIIANIPGKKHERSKPPFSATKGPMVLVNPVILPGTFSMKKEAYEGCLSHPGKQVKVSRLERVTIQYQNLKGETLKIYAQGLLARCLQHEIDHIDGVNIF